MFSADDTIYMQRAILLAETAANNNEVPVGAVLVRDGAIIGEGWNRPIGNHDATAHAEIIALRSAGENTKNYRLVNSTLYVTLEPCLMCLGAIVHARVARVVYGACDLKTGAVESRFQLGQSKEFNHFTEYSGSLLSHSCAELLRKFFQERRAL